MAYTKRIVCLANSWKPGGYCIAGRELVAQQPQGWIRPVSDAQGGAVPENDRTYATGKVLAVGDVVEITFKCPVPYEHQKENHLYDSALYWSLKSRVQWANLPALVERPESLWVNDFSSSNGTNDRVPDSIASLHNYSLLFIKIVKLTVDVSDNPWEKNKRRVRVIFSYNKSSYNLQLTDPVMQEEYFQKDNGSYSLSNVFLCISLGGILNGYAYKLAAGLFTQERFP